MPENPTTGFSAVERFLLRVSNDLLHILLSCLAADSLIMAGRTSKTMRSILRHYCGEAWEIGSFIQPWFGDVDSFLNVLHVTGAVVGGSQAMNFFRRTKSFTNFDLFVRLGGCPMLGKWLLRQGYRYMGGLESLDVYASKHYFDVYFDTSQLLRRRSRWKHARGAEKHGPGVLNVYNFYKFLATTDGLIVCLHVKMIATDMNPMHHILFHSHSSESSQIVPFDWIFNRYLAALINMITPNAAFCVFPISTLRDSISYISMSYQDSTAKSMEWVGKYRASGFQVIGKEGILLAPHPHYGARCVGDRRCFIVRYFHSECSPSFYLHISRIFCIETRPTSKATYGKANLCLPFDVIPADRGVVPGVGFLRVAEPFLWRSVKDLLQLLSLNSTVRLSASFQ